MLNWREISLHVGCFVDVGTFESWFPRTISLFVKYFFDVGFQLVTSDTAVFFSFVF